MKHYNAIIIGGGASGVMCALTTKNKSVAIIDKNTKLAKKIMVTGNGRCNLSNENMSSSFYNVNIDKYLNEFNVHDTLDFFSGLGLCTYADSEGRIYPLSNSAKSVVDCFDLHVPKTVDKILGETVLNIEVQNEMYIVTTNKNVYSCKKLVIATAYSEIIESLKKLGVSFVAFRPSLVALKCRDIAGLNGIKLSGVKVTAKTNMGKTKTDKGEVLFKDDGVSGIVVFNLSTLFSRDNGFDGTISIDMLPNISLDKLEKLLTERKSLGVKLDKFFTGMFLPAVANEIFMKAKINTNINSVDITQKDIKALAMVIKNLEYRVCGHYDNYQVFTGGVSLKDLSFELMHKRLKNLYFIGEICDVDGECGGYNLQWAWTSGKIVGDSL